MKRKLRLFPLLLAILLLTGCYFKETLLAGASIAFPDMEYVHPDISIHDVVLSRSCSIAKESSDLNEVLSAINAYYHEYDRFYASHDLAYIHYCSDVTDSYWAEEYEHCSKYAPTVDAGLETLYAALAQSPIRQTLEGDEYFGAGYFDAYEGDSVWDPTFLALLEEEKALISNYYALCEEASVLEYYSDAYFDAYAPKIGQLFAELVAKRQEIAAYAGYQSYPAFAYDFYHYRDYAPEEAEQYLIKLGQELTPFYRLAVNSDTWEDAAAYSSEKQTFSYLESAAKAMGGNIQRAFEHMARQQLYDITISENKYDTSFEVMLLLYYEPYVFTSPDGTAYDRLVFSHEFGHFVNDFIREGGYPGTDVAEVHSQGMEYLSTCYATEGQALEQLKLADSLSLYVEQSAYALFEHQVYDLTGDDLTPENIFALYEEIGTDFGFDSNSWDARDLITVGHFFDQPLYIVSYVVSNDLAMQLYQMEKAEAGAGLSVYQFCLSSSEYYIMRFADTYGLKSPFDRERLESLKQTFSDIFLPVNK